MRYAYNLIIDLFTGSFGSFAPLSSNAEPNEPNEALNI